VTSRPYLPYPDAERVVLAILEPVLPDKVDTWLPTPFQPPFIQVNRTGGGPDNSDVTDYPLMRVRFYGGDRSGAWDLAADGEKAMMSAQGRYISVPGIGSVLVDYVTIALGGTQDQDVDPDNRRVTKDFMLGLRRQYHLQPA
jgi:hypothetical protein